MLFLLGSDIGGKNNTKLDLDTIKFPITLQMLDSGFQTLSVASLRSHVFLMTCFFTPHVSTYFHVNVVLSYWLTFC